MGRYQLVKAIAIALALVLTGGFSVSAAQWSSTKAEFLYGWNYDKRKDKEGMILTLANATGWKYGDSYAFMDLGDAADRDETDGIHMEWGPRLSLLRAFGKQPLEGPLKDVYVIVQADIDANSFTNKVTLMSGVSADWNVPGFAFFKTHLQYRNDPTLDGDSAQFTIVWNMPFKIKNQKFSFEGFMDYTTSEGSAKSNVLTQPQLVWHITDNIGVGMEYQYWKNRLGRDGVDESVPQAMLRWTF